MKVFYTDGFALPLPSGHRFPLDKYARLRRRVVEDGSVAATDLRVPEAAADAALERAHTEAYLNRVASGALSAAEVRRIGFPWSAALVERSRRSTGATIAACRAALEEGVAVNLAGGTHHAFADRGEGFCVYNDVAVAARAMQRERRARRVVVLDCDVHQGNGTASIVRGDPTVFTFSIHGAGNFPFRKEPSDLDVALADGTGDEAYLDALEGGLERSLDRARADLAIFLAGADPYEDDRFGRLALTKEGLAERDRRVFAACRIRGIPLAITMSGGYARDTADTVDIHAATVAIAAS